MTNSDKLETVASFRFTREEFDEEMRLICAELAPRRFALFEEVGDREDGALAAWGLDLGDEAVVVSGRTLGRFVSAESARRRFARAGRTFHLVWLDPDAAGQPGPPASAAGAE